MVVDLVIDSSLRLFLARSIRDGALKVRHDGTSALGHLVQSIGIPLTEVGSLSVGGSDVSASTLPAANAHVSVHAQERPQALPLGERLVLDVHLGSLARRLRLLGVDAVYSTEATDDELVATCLSERRMLLTQDRGLLRRRAVRHAAAYVVGSGAEEQIRDVLSRFALTVRPLSRCVGCNGPLRAVEKQQLLDRLEPGTRRTYDDFAVCERCERPYWRGAHWQRIAAVLTSLGVTVPDCPP